MSASSCPAGTPRPRSPTGSRRRTRTASAPAASHRRSRGSRSSAPASGIPQIATATEMAVTSAYAPACAGGESGSPSSRVATATPAAPLVQTVRATEIRHVTNPIALPSTRPRTPNVPPEAVALLVAVREPRSIRGISRICPTAVPTAIAGIVAHMSSPNVIPNHPKATAPRPTDVPTKMTKNVLGVEVRSSSGMRSTPLRSNPVRPVPRGRMCGTAPGPAAYVSRVSTHQPRPPDRRVTGWTRQLVRPLRLRSVPTTLSGARRRGAARGGPGMSRARSSARGPAPRTRVGGAGAVLRLYDGEYEASGDEVIHGTGHARSMTGRDIDIDVSALGADLELLAGRQGQLRRSTGRPATSSSRVYPQQRDKARACRAFLARTVRYLAGEAGIRQFLDIGTGLPTANNTHEVAQARRPGVADRLRRQRPAGAGARPRAADQHAGGRHRLHRRRPARPRHDPGRSRRAPSTSAGRSR